MRGFTLIEILVAVTLISILAGAALPLAEMAIKRTKEQELRTSLRQLREAIDSFKDAADSGRILRRSGESGYPRSLQQLVDGVEDIKDPARAKLFFLRRIPRDPFNPDQPTGWGLRSFASTADDPRSGDDVFDVYSRSAGTGLNGVRYREW